MTRISPSHPRYRSLRVRAGLARALRSGLVVPEGLIAQGRGEAFDYFLGERTIPTARQAERTAAEWIRSAHHPVISVNGNVAALAAAEIARLVRTCPRLGVEVNLFHRTPARVRAVARTLRSAGLSRLYGLRPSGRIAGLDSDRARVDRQGIGSADLVLIPLEDGDRAEALRRAGRRIVSIDLNPLSRTSRAAHLPIVDELTRALTEIARALERPPPARRAPRGPTARGLLSEAQATMARNLLRSPRPAPRAKPQRRR
ncbi:MAG: phosphopantothenate/pantothenate synthetase [Thermoplasmata archaeon]